jgi:uncharacterized membrane protein (UPF0127 family)
MVLVNGRSDETLASDVELALTRKDRNRGLLGRDNLDSRAALVISPCWSIHTAFMRFTIDALFVDRSGRAVRIARNLPPWRIVVARRAHAVIEFRAGSLAPDVRIGDEICLVPPAAAHLNVLRRPAVALWDRVKAGVAGVAETP